MIAQGNFHFINAGIMPAQVISDLLMLFGAISLTALHLDNEFINRFSQGCDSCIKLVQKKPDDRNCNDLYDVKDILEDKINWLHARKYELSDLLKNSLRGSAFAFPTYRVEWK